MTSQLAKKRHLNLLGSLVLLTQAVGCGSDASRLLIKQPAPVPEPVPEPVPAIFLLGRGLYSPCQPATGRFGEAAEAVYGECATSLAMRRRL